MKDARDSNLSVISTSIADSGNESSYVNMKNKIIRRVTSLSSPITEEKRKCFSSLVKDDLSAVAIVSMAAENGNSVEDAKNMLLNFL